MKLVIAIIALFAAIAYATDATYEFHLAVSPPETFKAQLDAAITTTVCGTAGCTFKSSSISGNVYTVTVTEGMLPLGSTVCGAISSGLATISEVCYIEKIVDSTGNTLCSPYSTLAKCNTVTTYNLKLKSDVQDISKKELDTYFAQALQTLGSTTSLVINNSKLENNVYTVGVKEPVAGTFGNGTCLYISAASKSDTPFLCYIESVADTNNNVYCKPSTAEDCKDVKLTKTTYTLKLKIDGMSVTKEQIDVQVKAMCAAYGITLESTKFENNEYTFVIQELKKGVIGEGMCSQVSTSNPFWCFVESIKDETSKLYCEPSKKYESCTISGSNATYVLTIESGAAAKASKELIDIYVNSAVTQAGGVLFVSSEFDSAKGTYTVTVTEPATGSFGTKGCSALTELAKTNTNVCFITNFEDDEGKTFCTPSTSIKICESVNPMVTSSYVITLADIVAEKVSKNYIDTFMDEKLKSANCTRITSTLNTTDYTLTISGVYSGMFGSEFCKVAKNFTVAGSEKPCTITGVMNVNGTVYCDDEQLCSFAAFVKPFIMLLIMMALFLF